MEDVGRLPRFLLSLILILIPPILILMPVVVPTQVLPKFLEATVLLRNILETQSHILLLMKVDDFHLFLWVISVYLSNVQHKMKKFFLFVL